MTCTTPTKVVLRYEYTLSTWVEATWSAVDALARSFGSNVKYGYSCIAVECKEEFPFKDHRSKTADKLPVDLSRHQITKCLVWYGTFNGTNTL